MNLVIVDIHRILLHMWKEGRYYAQNSPNLEQFFKRALNKTVASVRRQDATHVLVVWPDYSHSRRRDYDPSYMIDKGLSMPRYMTTYFRRLSLRFESMGYGVVCIPGVECFDVANSVVGSLVENGKAKVACLSNDDRMWSLVSDHVSIVFDVSDNSAENFTMTPERLSSHFGESDFYPSNYLGYKVLCEFDGLGPEKSSALIKEHGSLEEVLGAAKRGDLSDRAGKLVNAQLKTVGRPMYRRYFPLKTGPIGVSLRDLQLPREASTAA